VFEFPDSSLGTCHARGSAGGMIQSTLNLWIGAQFYLWVSQDTEICVCQSSLTSSWWSAPTSGNIHHAKAVIPISQIPIFGVQPAGSGVTKVMAKDCSDIYLLQ